MEALAIQVSQEIKLCRSEQEIRDVILQAMFEALKKVREGSPTIEIKD